jgi:hypothetical protein
MTDKNISTETPETESTKKTAKPPISKTAVPSNDVPITQPSVAPVSAKPTSGTNGGARADTVSKGREALLNVDSYEDAETLLTERPDLIDQARTVFGTIVPTSGQNEFMDLAIRAAAEDDPTDLRSALKTKRQKKLNLTAPEIDQLLEFASEHINKSPVLALNVALLLTDGLTRLEETDLWEKQKKIILALEKVLDLDATALWEEISQEDRPSPPASEPKSKPVAEVKTPKKRRPAPPPPPPVHKPTKEKVGGPSRLLLASGFIFLMSVLSCGACAFGHFWF